MTRSPPPEGFRGLLTRLFSGFPNVLQQTVVELGQPAALCPALGPGEQHGRPVAEVQTVIEPAWCRWRSDRERSCPRGC